MTTQEKQIGIAVNPDGPSCAAPGCCQPPVENPGGHLMPAGPDLWTCAHRDPVDRCRVSVKVHYGGRLVARVSVTTPSAGADYEYDPALSPTVNAERAAAQWFTMRRELKETLAERDLTALDEEF